MEITVFDKNQQKIILSREDLQETLEQIASISNESSFDVQKILNKAQTYLNIFQINLNNDQQNFTINQFINLLINICQEENYIKISDYLNDHKDNIFNKDLQNTNFFNSAQIAKLIKFYSLTNNQNSKFDLFSKLAQEDKNIQQLLEQGHFLPHQNILKTQNSFSGMHIYLEDDLSNIFDQLKQIAINFQNLINTTVDFSSLRPKMSLIKSTQGYSSGPVSFIKIYTSTLEVLRQQISDTFTPLQTFTLNIHHPDILEYLIFIKNFQKNTLNKFIQFNIELTPNFIDALNKEEDYELINPYDQQVVNLLSAKNTFDLIISTFIENTALGLTLNINDEEKNNKIDISAIINFSSYTNIDNLLQDLPIIQNYLIKSQQNPQIYPNFQKQFIIQFTGWQDFIIQKEISYESLQNLELINQIFTQIKNHLSPNIKLSIDLSSPLLNIFNETKAFEPFENLAFNKISINGLENYQLIESLKTKLPNISNELIKQIFENNSLANIHNIDSKIKNLFKVSSEISPEFHLEIQKNLEKFINTNTHKKIYFSNNLDIENIKNIILNAVTQDIKSLTFCQFNIQNNTENTPNNLTETNFLHKLNKKHKRKHKEIQPPLFQIKKTEEVIIPPISHD